MQKDKIQQAAVKEFGALFQIDMVIEECAELIQALNKLKRAGLVLNDRVIHPSEKCVGTIYHDTCSEIADVKNLLNQMDFVFDPEFIKLSEDRKIERLGNNLIKRENSKPCKLILNYVPSQLIIHPINNCTVVVSLYGFIKPVLGYYEIQDKKWYIFPKNKYFQDFQCYKFCDLWIKTWRYLTMNELEQYQQNKIIKFDE
jgi:hypothetical protein